MTSFAEINDLIKIKHEAILLKALEGFKELLLQLNQERPKYSEFAEDLLINTNIIRHHMNDGNFIKAALIYNSDIKRVMETIEDQDAQNYPFHELPYSAIPRISVFIIDEKQTEKNKENALRKKQILATVYNALGLELPDDSINTPPQQSAENNARALTHTNTDPAGTKTKLKTLFGAATERKLKVAFYDDPELHAKAITLINDIIKLENILQSPSVNTPENETTIITSQSCLDTIKEIISPSTFDNCLEMYGFCISHLNKKIPQAVFTKEIIRGHKIKDTADNGTFNKKSRKVAL